MDPAFEKLPAWFLQSLRDDIKLLRAFIMNHFIKIEVLLESLGNEFLIMNARSGGNRLRINVYNQESDYVSTPVRTLAFDQFHPSGDMTVLPIFTACLHG